MQGKFTEFASLAKIVVISFAHYCAADAVKGFSTTNGTKSGEKIQKNWIKAPTINDDFFFFFISESEQAESNKIINNGNEIVIQREIRLGNICYQ